MTKELSKGRISNPEVAQMRAKLRIRWNMKEHIWEVYTTVHGTWVYKWFKIDNAKASWYLRTFPELNIERILNV